MDQLIDTKYKFLRRWRRPQDYAGPNWYDYFIGLGRHRDSDTLDTSNFDCMLRDIGGQTETVFIVRAGHWAVGWVEFIAIHESDTTALDKAEKIFEKLEEYGIVDEEHHMELEYTRVENYWDACSIRERLAFFKEHAKDLPPFAARHKWSVLVRKYSERTDYLYDYLRSE